MGDDTQNRCRRDPAEIPTEGWREFAKGQFANRNPARVSARERVAGERDWPRR